MMTNISLCRILVAQLLVTSPIYAFLGRKFSKTSESSVAVSTSSSSLEEKIALRTRPDFDILSSLVGENKKPLIYLDSAATSQKPNSVLETLDDYYRHYNANVHRGAHTLSRQATSAYEAARDKVAEFIKASNRDEIVFTKGATEAINLIASTYGRSENLQEGDEIVLTVAEHHANLVPWQMLAKEKRLRLKFVPLKEDESLDFDQLDDLLTEKTKIVGFQHVSNVLACVNPVKKIVDKVRTLSPRAVIVLDACQSVPHMSVNVQELGVDFLTASGHKMCGPTGIGFLWGKLDILNSMPPYQGGGEMIDQVSLEESTFLPSPSRFEAGTPAIAQAIGLGAAIDYITSIGMDQIESYEHEIGKYLHERLSQVPGIRIFGPTENRVSLAAFTHESIHPSDLSTFLDLDGVAVRAGHHCCQPLHKELGVSHSARASLYFYNTRGEVDAFISSLEKTIDFFSSAEPDANGDDKFVPFI